MVYSESLAGRVRHTLSRTVGVTETKMFGGVCFLSHGNMVAGVWKSSLILRVGAKAAAQALAESHVGPFDVTGRPMTGWLMIEPNGVETERQLLAWLDRALSFVRSLPPKKPAIKSSAPQRKGRRS